MESLLKGLEDGTLGETSGPTAEDKKFKEAWSKIMGDTEPSASTSTSTAPGSAAKSSQKGPEGSFQDRIKQTMDKIKEGGSSLEVRNPTDEPRRHSHLSSPTATATRPLTLTWCRSCHP